MKLLDHLQTYLRQNILSGALAPETRLPATRQLAQDLGISRITVKNAYAELESEGLIYTREGSGTYVMPPVPLPAPLESDAGILWPLWQQEAQAAEESHSDLFPTSVSAGASKRRAPAPVSGAGRSL